MTRRVLIISHHPAIGRGLKALLETMPEIDVVAVVGGGAVLDEALVSDADVVLIEAQRVLDSQPTLVGMPRTARPGVRVVVFGIYPGQETAARRAGANAFVVADAGEAALRAAILGESPDVGREPLER